MPGSLPLADLVHFGASIVWRASVASDLAINCSLGKRLLFGCLSREGMRVSEALSLRWRDVDLERGSVSLDKNKTDDVRRGCLTPA